MSGIHLEIEIPETDILMFKKAVRHLLDSTFVLKEKEEKLYRFIAREANRFEISQYLQAIGYDLIVEEKAGVAMLVISEQDEDTEGIRRSNIIQFNQLQYHLLLILWQAYLECLGSDDGTYIVMGNLVDRIRSYGVEVGSQELKSALKLFKKYVLINYNEDEKGEEAKIRLYPSLQFGWDLPQFKDIADSYLFGAGTENEDAEEDTEDNADNEEPDADEEDFV